MVPVPLHPVRLRERGYNQAEALASVVSRQTGVPVTPCLQRVRYTLTQTRFDRVQRRRNLRGAFALRKSTGVTGQRLLLIDDVLTTGSTLHECAAVLLDRGARSVRALTVARGRPTTRLWQFPKTVSEAWKSEKARDARGPLAKMPGVR
jgi:competence protein ComFC